MPDEIEIKMKAEDFATVRESLKRQGAKYESSVLETNTFFDTPERTLLGQDKGLRIRHARNVQNDEEKTIITFKGPRKPGAIKTREERELKADNPIDAMSLLSALGFVRMLAFQKRRESWTLNGCHIELDEVPYLGKFVEIEGPSEDVIQKTREVLELANSPHVSSSYASLLIDYWQKHGLNESVITFK